MEVRCFEDLDMLGTEIGPLEALDQDNYHRIVDPPGSNPDDKDWGLGIPRLLSGNEHDLGSLAPRIEAELRKDPRNAEVRARVAVFAAGIYDISYRVVPDPDELGVAVTQELITNLRASADGVERV